MDFEATPAPTEEERAAIADALDGLDAQERSPYESAWRRAGLQPDEDDYAATPPRSSRGATRA